MKLHVLISEIVFKLERRVLNFSEFQKKKKFTLNIFLQLKSNEK